MTLSQLHYVIKISEAGSLNKAAEQLYVSQPSLTGAVKELEKELDIVIFNRTSKGVTLTNDGREFLLYARQVYGQYEILKEKYTDGTNLKKKFCVSTQHYSFAVKAFVETAKKFDMSKYEFALRETITKDIINDVSSLRSEIGILYLSNFNRSVLTRLFNANELEFHKLIDCRAYVYIWNGHPLADKKSVSFEDLKDYPCLTFEQGDNASFYFAEELISPNESEQVIKVCDRATMLNLMVGLCGYTVCSGIICEELNGSDYCAVPFDLSDPRCRDIMEVGYIIRKNSILSKTGKLYVNELKNYLENCISQL